MVLKFTLTSYYFFFIVYSDLHFVAVGKNNVWAPVAQIAIRGLVFINALRYPPNKDLYQG